MINAIIIEDEPVAAKIIQRFISSLDEVVVKEIFHAAEPAMEWLTDNTTDVIFLDINLPDLSGIDFIKSLPAPPKVIFTTANPAHAVEGFELDAIDYLVKPIAFERFKKAVDKLKNALDTEQTADQIAFKANNRTYLINRHDIFYLQSAGDYVKVFSAHHNLVVNQTMKELEKQLKSPFLRIHKSFMVNINAIQYLEGNSLKVTDKLIPVGAKYREKISKLIR